jgi:hypothetical protein
MKRFAVVAILSLLGGSYASPAKADWGYPQLLTLSLNNSQVNSTSELYLSVSADVVGGNLIAIGANFESTSSNLPVFQCQQDDLMMNWIKVLGGTSSDLHSSINNAPMWCNGGYSQTINSGTYRLGTLYIQSTDCTSSQLQTQSQVCQAGNHVHTTVYHDGLTLSRMNSGSLLIPDRFYSVSCNPAGDTCQPLTMLGISTYSVLLKKTETNADIQSEIQRQNQTKQSAAAWAQSQLGISSTSSSVPNIVKTVPKVRQTSQIASKHSSSNPSNTIQKIVKKQILKSKTKASPIPKKTKKSNVESSSGCSAAITSKLVKLITAIQSWKDAVKQAQLMIAVDNSKLVGSDSSFPFSQEGMLVKQDLSHFENQLNIGPQYIQQYQTDFDTLAKSCLTTLTRP